MPNNNQSEDVERKFNAIFPCVNPQCDNHGTLTVMGSGGEPEPEQCEYCYRERLPLKELFTTHGALEYARGRSEALEEAGKIVRVHHLNSNEDDYSSGLFWGAQEVQLAILALSQENTLKE